MNFQDDPVSANMCHFNLLTGQRLAASFSSACVRGLESDSESERSELLHDSERHHLNLVFVERSIIGNFKAFDSRTLAATDRSFSGTWQRGQGSWSPEVVTCHVQSPCMQSNLTSNLTGCSCFWKTYGPQHHQHEKSQL